MNEVYGQFFDVDREMLYRRTRAAQCAAARPVRVRRPAAHGAPSQNGPHVFLAFVQGAGRGRQGRGFKKNPFQRRRPGRRARPRLGGARPPARRRGPINSESLHFSRFIQDVYFDSQVTVGCSAPPRSACSRPGDPQAAPAAQLHRVAAGREPHRTPDRGDPQLRQPHLGLAAACSRTASSTRACRTSSSWSGRSRRTTPTRGRATTSRSPPRLDDDPEQPDAALAPRRREGRLPDLRLIRAPQGAARRSIPASSTSASTRASRRRPPTRPRWAPRPTCRRRRATGRSSTSSSTTPASGRRPSMPSALRRRSCTEKLRNGVPDLRWLTEFGQPCGAAQERLRRDRHHLRQQRGHLPEVCAHMLGQLLKYMGEDRIVFGSDCLVRRAAMADRGAVALPDPAGDGRRYGYPALTRRSSARSSASTRRASTTCRPASARTSGCPRTTSGAFPTASRRRSTSPAFQARVRSRRFLHAADAAKRQARGAA